MSFFIDNNLFQLVYVKTSSGTENESERTRNLEVASKVWETKVVGTNPKINWIMKKKK